MMKKQKLIGQVSYLQDEVEGYQTKLSSLRKDILKVESDLVGSKEKLLRAREALRRHDESLCKREVTAREYQIAHMLGVSLNIGDPLSDKEWAQIFINKD